MGGVSVFVDRRLRFAQNPQSLGAPLDSSLCQIKAAGRWQPKSYLILTYRKAGCCGWEKIRYAQLCQVHLGNMSAGNDSC